jgi:hypothetical protein
MLLTNESLKGEALIHLSVVSDWMLPVLRQIQEILEFFDLSFGMVTKQGSDGEANLYSVDKHEGLYIIDSPEGRELACNPSQVGDSFEVLNRELSRKAWKFLSSLGIRGPIIFEHVLRAAPGYRLRETIPQDIGPVTDFYVRPRYVQESFRHHVQNEVEVVYSGELRIGGNRSFTLVKPDTEATGRSSVKVIEELLRRCQDLNSSISRVVLYGFISQRAFDVIKELAKEHGFELLALAIEDVTALGSNGYDMPIYGLDEQIFRNAGVPAKLSSIIPEDVFQAIVTRYYPGLDQPGDWSERQIVLFNGLSYENADTERHLLKSLNALESLREISRKEPWYMPLHEEIFKNVKESLQARINSVVNNR